MNFQEIRIYVLKFNVDNITKNIKVMSVMNVEFRN